jgi:hypothetical protein
MLPLFLSINLLTIHLMSDRGLPAMLSAGACSDDIVRAGWLLQFHERPSLASNRFFNA